MNVNQEEFDSHIKLMSHQAGSMNEPSKTHRENEQNGLLRTPLQLLSFFFLRETFQISSTNFFTPFCVITITNCDEILITLIHLVLLNLWGEENVGKTSYVNN